MEKISYRRECYESGFNWGYIIRGEVPPSNQALLVVHKALLVHHTGHFQKSSTLE